MDVLLWGNTGESPKVSGNSGRPASRRPLEGQQHNTTGQSVRNWHTGIRRG